VKLPIIPWISDAPSLASASAICARSAVANSIKEKTT
jgi:hypothetical protein